MSTKRALCGHAMSKGRGCGRPANHSGPHRSLAALRSRREYNQRWYTAQEATSKGPGASQGAKPLEGGWVTCNVCGGKGCESCGGLGYVLPGDERFGQKKRQRTGQSDRAAREIEKAYQAATEEWPAKRVQLLDPPYLQNHKRLTTRCVDRVEDEYGEVHWVLYGEQHTYTGKYTLTLEEWLERNPKQPTRLAPAHGDKPGNHLTPESDAALKAGRLKVEPEEHNDTESTADVEPDPDDEMARVERHVDRERAGTGDEFRDMDNYQVTADEDAFQQSIEDDDATALKRYKASEGAQSEPEPAPEWEKANPVCPACQKRPPRSKRPGALCKACEERRRRAQSRPHPNHPGRSRIRRSRPISAPTDGKNGLNSA